MADDLPSNMAGFFDHRYLSNQGAQANERANTVPQHHLVKMFHVLLILRSLELLAQLMHFLSRPSTRFWAPLLGSAPVLAPTGHPSYEKVALGTPEAQLPTACDVQ